MPKIDAVMSHLERINKPVSTFSHNNLDVYKDQNRLLLSDMYISLVSFCLSKLVKNKYTITMHLPNRQYNNTIQ